MKKWCACWFLTLAMGFAIVDAMRARCRYLEVVMVLSSSALCLTFAGDGGKKKEMKRLVNHALDEHDYLKGGGQ